MDPEIQTNSPTSNTSAEDTPRPKRKLLGSGTYGKAYLTNEVVTKVCDLMNERSDELCTENLNEIAFLKTIDKYQFDCFPKILDIRTTKDKIEIDMTYNGMNLKKWCTRHNYKTRVKMLPLLTVQLARILVLLQDLNVMHFDIKPHNICIKKKHLTLIDFGLVTYCKSHGSTMHSTISFGDPRYYGYKLNACFEVDNDVFSLGSTLAYVLFNDYSPKEEKDFVKMKSDKEIFDAYYLDDLYKKSKDDVKEWINFIKDMLKFDNRISRLDIYNHKLLDEYRDKYPLIRLEPEYKLYELPKDNNLEKDSLEESDSKEKSNSARSKKTSKKLKKKKNKKTKSEESVNENKSEEKLVQNNDTEVKSIDVKTIIFTTIDTSAKKLKIDYMSKLIKDNFEIFYDHKFGFSENTKMTKKKCKKYMIAFLYLFCELFRTDHSLSKIQNYTNTDYDYKEVIDCSLEILKLYNWNLYPIYNIDII